MTLQELKANGFDIIVKISQLHAQIQQLNQTLQSIQQDIKNLESEPELGPKLEQ
jgi:prefoldin subunit 5